MHDANNQIVLVFDLEDYFQAPQYRKFIQARDWYRFQSRLKEVVPPLLALLHERQARATFLIDAWTALRQPDLVQALVDSGHEAALRMDSDSSAAPREGIAQRLVQAKEILEQAAGISIRGLGTDGEASDAAAAAGFAYEILDRPRRLRGTLPRLVTAQEQGWWLSASIGTSAFITRHSPDAVCHAWRHWASVHGKAPVVRLATWEFDAAAPQISAIARRATAMEVATAAKELQERLAHLLRHVEATSAAQAFQLPAPSPVAARRPVSLLATTQVAKDSPSQSARPQISLVVPCFNEEDSLPHLHQMLDSVEATLRDDCALTWLFVDDGSTDRTWDALQPLAADRPNVRLLRHEVNRGICAAIRTGLAAAHTELVASIDCDGSYDPHELKAMLPLMKDHIALVTASPYHPAGGVRNVPGWRLILSRGASQAYRTILRSRLHTFTSCFRIYRRSCILPLPLKEDRFLGTAELVGELLLRGEQVAEYPTTLNIRVFGQSKLKTARTILGHLRLLYRLARTQRRSVTAEPVPPVAPQNAARS